MPHSTICLTFDFDAISVWLEYGTGLTPNMLQRGEYGARVGVPRVLELLRRYNLPATFFVPGHTADSYPNETASIVEAGHELAHHTYAHIEPSGLSYDEERSDLERGLQALTKFGVKPIGFRTGGQSWRTLELLEEYGFLYDSSFKGDDFRPYRPRIGDCVSQHEPLVKGREARLWEMPTQYEFDDWVHFNFSFSPYRNGTSAPSKVLEIWMTQLRWMNDHVNGGVLTVLMHPQVIGRAHAIDMLENFIQYGLKLGVAFKRMDHVAMSLGKPWASV
jgi:peptidoglycan/xylan/chitin deacetylase (PgdA/CDA1 family)